jgi:hypothetical protein
VLKDQIEEAKERLEKYKKKSSNIEKKKDGMKIYEEFLEKVKEANPDEFPELIDIL